MGVREMTRSIEWSSNILEGFRCLATHLKCELISLSVWISAWSVTVRIVRKKRISLFSVNGKLLRYSNKCLNKWICGLFNCYSSGIEEDKQNSRLFKVNFLCVRKSNCCRSSQREEACCERCWTEFGLVSKQLCRSFRIVRLIIVWIISETIQNY